MAAQSISPRRAVLTLGATQTIGYACSSYLPASLAGSMSQAVGTSTAFVFAAFSGALLIHAFVGPAAGRSVDRNGARLPLSAASIILALGLVGMALSQTAWQLVLAWLVLGLGMALGLYDIAFAGLVGWFGLDARRSITGVTLIAGFASTVAWPLTAWLDHEIGWRGACLVWAAANLLICLPLHLTLPRDAPHVAAPTGEAEPGGPLPAPAAFQMILLATALAVMAGIGSIMGAHLPPLLVAMGASAAAAVAAGMLVGPAQVAARFAEFVLVRRIHPLNSGRAAVVAFPIGASLLLALGPIAAVPFAILYGVGNGLFTIVRGTLPLALFGTLNYGGRLGTLNVPARLVGAVAPLLFALALGHSAQLALGVLIGASLLAFGCLMLLRRPD
ncbi:MFS transporter [Phenylobacterium sp.]|uniref:MFS transporter n=1 Tax=Phenylobacterium sp. TaxID=1871053 RepID=UPI00286CBD50|nr:MFS transporter [Phenylobacterium sp.]